MAGTFSTMASQHMQTPPSADAWDHDLVLAGDVGGTNSRFMLYEANYDMVAQPGKCPPGRLLFKRQYPNEGVSNFAFQVKRFLQDANRAERPPLVACFAMAGPVAENRCQMTNRGWLIDGYELAYELGIHEVRLINDFVAAGFGLLTLDLATEVVTLQEGTRCLGAPIACIGSGTGLGETYLTAAHGTQIYEAYPTEGGHSTLPVKTPLEYEMVQWMKEHLNIGRISVERVVSGTGLGTVYEFLAQKYPDKVDSAVHAQIQAIGDQKGKVIGMAAEKDKAGLCAQAVEMWAKHYGAEAGTACLKFLPLGGLFLAGGMTPKLLSWIRGEGSSFMKAMRDQGRMSAVVQSVPVYAVMEEDIGQRGAHYVALTMYHKDQDRLRANGVTIPGMTSFATWRTGAIVGMALASAGAGALLARFARR